MNSSHKGQWRGTLMFTLICTWINGWVNNGEAGDLRRHRAHYDVIVMGYYIRLGSIRVIQWQLSFKFSSTRLMQSLGSWMPLSQFPIAGYQFIKSCTWWQVFEIWYGDKYGYKVSKNHRKQFEVSPWWSNLNNPIWPPPEHENLTYRLDLRVESSVIPLFSCF